MPATALDPAAAVFPEPFPEPWASDWGEDDLGLWMALTLGDVRQVFRWIAPGRFLMGSPANEAERGEDEAQHEVMLSRGFWLADTACTQALWQEVTGANPSKFQDDERNPVEQVSWDDVQAFIAELDRRVHGLQARLPTEAEWEYACRAATTTPFSFGDNITPEQVNFNGDYPYAVAQTGLNRRRTVPVRSLPGNPWGLYEMHGNVWEWCSDWYGEDVSGPQVDPHGTKTGVDRVSRGGSWNRDGWFVRCACRNREAPDYHSFSLGFRFALGTQKTENKARQA